MQEAMFINPGREALLSAPALRSLGQLNRRFLDLVCAEGGAQEEWSLPVPSALRSRLLCLGGARCDALAQSPYALFDIRFFDDPLWEAALQSLSQWRVEDVPGSYSRSAEFLQLALFYAWHLAQTQPLSAPLILGMSEHIARALAKVTLDRLPGLMYTHRHHLGLRWPNCLSFWHPLTAAQPGSPAFRKAQLFGFQVAAAVRISS